MFAILVVDLWFTLFVLFGAIDFGFGNCGFGCFKCVLWFVILLRVLLI